MRKSTASLAALLLTVILCIGCFGSGFAQAPDENLAKAFSGGGTPRLVPVDLPGSSGGYGEPVALSPDGKIVLWRSGREFILTRDGTPVPLSFNASRGAGDPYGKEPFSLTAVSRQPSREGPSWSADGNLIAFSDLEMGLKNMRSPDVQVLDTVSGEVFLADTFDKNLLRGGALVYLSRVDRSGKYLYYLLLTSVEEETRLQFCRCPAEGGNREILYDMPCGDNQEFDLASGSNLYEVQDGSWLLTGIRGNTRNSENRKTAVLALIRFSPSGDRWTPEISSLRIPAGLYDYTLSDWSAVSGCGLLCVMNTSTSGASSGAMSMEAILDNPIEGVVEHVNVVRVLPGSDTPRDVWYLKKTGEGDGDVMFLPADDFLWSVKVSSGRLDADETAEAAIWMARNQEDESSSVVLPKGYGTDEYTRELRDGSRLTVLAACISPDGYFALINANVNRGYHLYLVDLKTMQVRPVETPEGVGGVVVSATPMAGSYRPGFLWNEDGTLLINGDDGVRAFRLEVGP